MKLSVKGNGALVASLALSAPVLLILMAEVWRMLHGLPPIPASGWESFAFPIGVAGFFAAQSVLGLVFARRNLRSLKSLMSDLEEQRQLYVEARMALMAAGGLVEVMEEHFHQAPPESGPSVH